MSSFIGLVVVVWNSILVWLTRLPLVPMHSVVSRIFPRIDVLEKVHRLARIHIHIVILALLIHPVTDGIIERVLRVQHRAPMLVPHLDLLLRCISSQFSSPNGFDIYKAFFFAHLTNNSDVSIVLLRIFR
jgi:hypothetical protein